MANNTYFDELIKSDNDLSFFKNDLGLKLLSKSLEYKIDTTKDKISSDIKEMYSPKLELTLLAHLLYNVGYIRFKRPLKISANIVSGDDIQLAKNTRFTNGTDIYYLDDLVSLEKEVPREIFLTNSKHYIKDYVVENTSLYFKIPTNVSYKELYKVEIKKDNVKLKYSQLFVKYDSEFSYEIHSDGLVYIVVLLGNESGTNIKLGDVLNVKIITAPDTVEVPNNLAIIENGYNTIVTDISLSENYISPMSILDMQNMIKFGRKNIGDIILNDDYVQFIKSSVSGIKSVKVWQEREETKEVGYKIENINKVFISYIGVDDNVSLDDEIIETVQNNIYGKPVTIKEAIIVDISVSIIINTKEGVGSATKYKVKDIVKGYYDDVHKILNTGKIYGAIFKVISDDLNDFTIDVTITDKGEYKNRNFFFIDENNIDININQLG